MSCAGCTTAALTRNWWVSWRRCGVRSRPRGRASGRRRRCWSWPGERSGGRRETAFGQREQRASEAFGGQYPQEKASLALRAATGPAFSVTHTDRQQRINRVQVSIVVALQDVAPDVAILDTRPDVEDAAAARKLEVGMGGHEDATDGVGAVPNLAKPQLLRAPAATRVNADPPRRAKFGLLRVAPQVALAPHGQVDERLVQPARRHRELRDDVGHLLAEDRGRLPEVAQDGRVARRGVVVDVADAAVDDPGAGQLRVEEQRPQAALDHPPRFQLGGE